MYLPLHTLTHAHTRTQTHTQTHLIFLNYNYCFSETTQTQIGNSIQVQSHNKRLLTLFYTISRFTKAEPISISMYSFVAHSHLNKGTKKKENPHYDYKHSPI